MEQPSVPKSRVLGESELKAMLTAALQREHVRELGELELTFVRSWSPITVPDSGLTVKIVELPTLGVTANFIVGFELFAGEKSLGRWQMPLKARVWRDVWVARTPLRHGEPLANADCVRERRDVLTLREPYIAGDADETTLELAEDVPAGMPLLARSVRPRTVVHRGQVVEAILRDGSMAVALKAEVLENGAIGQQVRVRNVQSKREFRGKVESEATISVSL
ncbi:MAG TPA: flagellar basal body P-ring formation chaperone FlgA [Verrucomicrobiae bacterium]|nr:flagellar basal body P-ring formation chaperone FlgA [Verrucomicrobiae bacterium]